MEPTEELELDTQETEGDDWSEDDDWSENDDSWWDYDEDENEDVEADDK